MSSFEGFLTRAGAISLALGLLVGCSGGEGDGSGSASASASASEGSTSEETGASTSAGGSTTTAGSATTTDASASAGSTGSSSGDATTTGDPGTDNECDPSKQDCPEGEKCTPYVKEGMGCCVNATHCVPDEGDKQFGDLCTRMNGTDDCDVGLFCHTKTSGGEGEGVCIVLCDPEDPNTCEGVCYAWNDGALPLCDVECDPLIQDCVAPKHGCYPILSEGKFVCIVNGYGDGLGKDGDACEVVQGCEPGLVCESGTVQEGCDSDSCCTPVCDLTGDPNQCQEATEECVSPWAEGEAPVGYENVGFCVIPT
ncbi:MAG: hypothetical protein H6711_06310 [Myxococcales bacterium]|nr:hypothetical protein [Myxococcales bacterium]